MTEEQAIRKEIKKIKHLLETADLKNFCPYGIDVIFHIDASSVCQYFSCTDEHNRKKCPFDTGDNIDYCRIQNTIIRKFYNVNNNLKKCKKLLRKYITMLEKELQKNKEGNRQCQEDELC